MSCKERYAAEVFLFKLEDHKLALRRGIALLIFHTNVSKFSHRL